MSWSRRLQQECDARGWGPSELSRAVPGLSHDSAKKYLRGKVAQPRGNKLPAIAAAMGLRLQWLRDNTGERYVNGRPRVVSSLKGVKEANSAHPSETQGIIDMSEDTILGSEDAMEERLAYQIIKLIPCVSLDVLETVRNILANAPRKPTTTSESSRLNP